jgi:hypothetical protein
MRQPLLRTFVTLLVLAAFAAPAAAMGPGIGVRLGATGGDMSVDPSTGITDGPSPRMGILAGVYKGLPLGPMSSLEFGAYYIQKGVKTTFETFGETEGRLDYLEIPVLFKVKPMAFPVYVAGGGYYSFKLSAKEKAAGSDWVDAEGVKSSDLGLGFAVGMDFPLTALTLNLDLRYDLGLVNIQSEGDGDMKTKTFMASVGFYF